VWIFETEKAGIFWIRFDPRGRGRFLLGIDGETLSSYYSPEAAADDVFLQTTGWSLWDSLESPRKPDSLDDWIRRDCTA
jgi:hypothetical protein